ncbi:hypothetical protein FOZ60_010054 [Perkinsus olseni]|uniref:Uncharacterized protein n=1 Tax=Perkinsus olseni TaxID=32597 RepID=A0A7J6NGF3_PEROL|nr:hypothetical protein FOZ60_010054 [Perkinsus olseni]
MREMREMMQAIVQERNTSRNPGERREAHRVISEGYASSDFDSVQSGELPFEENVRPTGERVGVDLLNPSADAPARVRVQFSDGMAHGSAEPPHRGNQPGTEFDDPVSQHHPDSDLWPLNQDYKERVRRECHKLATKSEIFTGKSSQEITIASLHRDIEETAEDHGWDELSVGSYYLLRYPLSRSVWDNVIDSIGRSFDRSCAAGFKARVEAIRRVLERTYSNAVVRDKLKTQWKQLRRNPAESCRDFISRVQNARKELQHSGALVEDSDEISVWRNGLFEPYSDWVGQYLAVAAVEGHPYGPRSIQQLRAEIQIRGDEFEDRHGVAAVPSTATSHSSDPPGSSEQGGLYTATQRRSQLRQDQPISRPIGSGAKDVMLKTIQWPTSQM